MSRTYEPIWVKLKTKATGMYTSVELKVMPVYLARVKKAITKEKDMDLGFKVLNEDDEYRLSFKYFKAENKLVVKLKPRYGIEDKKI